MILPSATFRVQLRSGMTFARLVRHLPYVVGLGISHLYLSPIFTAVSGSTHGYDIVDPDEVDPALGGLDGFLALSHAAKAAGLGIILDIVPNHLAFSTENPWLRDVLRRGQSSRFAAHFDIDWSRGRLVLPLLTAPFEARLTGGHVSVANGPDGPEMRDVDVAVPVVWSGPLPTDHDGIRAVHDAQAWRLTRWQSGRDAITHRRFFHVTGLVGMRVEDPAVYDDMHRLTFELLERGAVQGLRIDHIDGLANPAAYLARLRARVGATPVWVEKILTGKETLPHWPVQGTTGYEAGRRIAQVLTDPDGIARIDAQWRAVTGIGGSFADAVAVAKTEVLPQMLAAELYHLVALARDALADEEPGDEALREALAALLIACPRYRTYLADEDGCDDLALLRGMAYAAGATLQSPLWTDLLAARIADGQRPADRALRTRFQQVTGALQAKALEDNAGFRWTRCLGTNEVGSDPDDPAMSPDAFGEWLATRTGTDLTLTSSHDTKRAEDARMRLIAATHAPDALARLWQASGTVSGADRVPAAVRWYIVQSLLAMWQDDRDDIAERLAAHAEKYLREAGEITCWPYPATDHEAPVLAYATALAQSWRRDLPDGAARLCAIGEALSLAQVAIKLVMPGIPDIYQGTEGPALHLTDPDNREQGSVDRWEGQPDDGSFAARKITLTRRLLHLRREAADFFRTARVRVAILGPKQFSLIREAGGATLTVAVDLREGAADPARVDWAPAGMMAAQ